MKNGTSAPSITHTDAPKLSIPKEDILQMEADGNVPNWNLSVSRVFAIEILTCIHSNVFLKDLSAKQLGLIIKILNYFNKHFVALVDINKGQESSYTAPSPSMSGSKNTPGGNSLSSGSASQTLNLEELVWAALDLHLLAEWINKYFVTSVIVALKPQPGQVERQTDVVKSCFDKQVSSTLSVVPIIWNKMSDILVADCKSSLKVRVYSVAFFSLFFKCSV